MNLDDRKKLILQAIVEDYISTAEPVGSRSIAKKPELNISAATIRNEMGDLEDMGLLLQPHASSGRIPSKEGYKFYVNSLMNRYEMTAREITRLKDELLSHIKEMDDIVKQVSTLFSTHTSLPIIGIMPSFDRRVVRALKLVLVDEYTIMVIITADMGMIKNKLLRLREPVSEEFIEKLNPILNRRLAGKTLTSINLDDIMEIQNAVGVNVEILSSVLDLVHQAICEMDNKEVYAEGLTNILRFPEYNDINKIKEIFEVFEDKKDLGNLTDMAPHGKGIKVLIGGESVSPKLKDNGIVLSGYQVSDDMYGVIGVVGPMRMDYSKVVSHLEFVSDELSKALKRRYTPENF